MLAATLIAIAIASLRRPDCRSLERSGDDSECAKKEQQWVESFLQKRKKNFEEADAKQAAALAAANDAKGKRAPGSFTAVPPPPRFLPHGYAISYGRLIRVGGAEPENERAVTDRPVRVPGPPPKKMQRSSAQERTRMVRKLQESGLLSKPPPWWSDPPAWMRDLPWWLRRTLHTEESRKSPQPKGFERQHDTSLERQHTGDLSTIPKVSYSAAAAAAPRPQPATAADDATSGGHPGGAWLPFGRREDAIVEALRRNEL